MNTIAAPEIARQPADRRGDGAPSPPSHLGSYCEAGTGAGREILAIPGAHGSTLVIDRRTGTLADARLVAHLAADEPAENARVVCSLYLADTSKGRCRAVDSRDLRSTPFNDASADPRKALPSGRLRDTQGTPYSIRHVSPDGRFPELRWTRGRGSGARRDFDVTTLRDVVARLQDYEPARTQTASALAAHRDDPVLSVCVLRAEIERLTASAIVLNRRLREAVQSRLATEQLTMSEIAIRCGRVKRDRRGNVSGETSWLARRIGLTPESGHSEPTPWISSDVLALIAREGLGVAPNEVEL